MTKKLPARALFYAVMVAIFVSLISGAILLSSYHQHMLMGYYQNKERLIHNCQSGVELILGAQRDSIPKTVVDLFQKERDSLLLEQKAWGLLDVAFVKSWSGQGFYLDSVSRSFFVGKQAPNYALKLAEGTEPLKLCGNTQLIGDVFLPREGVERGFIHGKPYQGKTLVDGKIEVVERFMDNSFLKDRFRQLAALDRLSANHVLESDSLTHSFGKPSLVLVDHYFNTEGLVLKGNILIKASNTIRVSATSQLEDVLLVAPVIVIESGFQGSLQAFAWDSIVVESNVVLNYPTVLGLLPYEERIQFSPTISLQPFSVVHGAVVLPSFRYNEYKSKVQIQAEAVVNGQVWVNGVLEHRGTVYGSVFCEEFLLKTPAALYENYLLDAIIDRRQLSPYFLAAPIFSLNSKKGIIKEIE